MVNVLLADDDTKLLALLERGFRYEGFDVATAADGRTCLRLARDGRPDLIILDIGMPDIDGLSVCAQLRESTDVPVLMLTARDDVDDKVRALDLGADDYVTKPFAFDELIARVRALMRRRPGAGGRQFADLVCDPTTREASRGGRPLGLSPREFDLLYCFLRRPHTVLSRDTLLRDVWGVDFEGDAKIVDVYVGYLRQKLGEPRLIQTVRGIGYVLKG
ncbi:MAG TPA: response regulator transcription factor [bacterium]|jgi:DNA-binding response OmpR family regulator|nr:response regulator transcription factor [bacterium]